jgi:hypothetical protein
MRTIQQNFQRFRFPARTIIGLAVAGVLTACGGGAFFGFGPIDDVPPAVSLASAATTVKAGATVRFVAAASDENGIDSVAFYRVDSNGSTLLGSDSNAPYEWVVTAPSDGRTTLGVFARATDTDGNEADSSTVTIDITP